MGINHKKRHEGLQLINPSINNNEHDRDIILKLTINMIHITLISYLNRV